VVKPELTEAEEQEAQERTSVKAHVVHEAIRLDGDTELERSVSALASSGLLAGLSMGFSLIAQGLLRSHLPDTEWRPLLAKFGYSFGFLLVIVGRQQLFTENTLTAVLPVLARRSMPALGRMLRLWIIVLVANLAGAHVVAWVLGNTHAFAPEVQNAFAQIGRESAAVSFNEALIRGVFAGWLIAALVWMRAALDSGHIPLIVLITWLVAIGSFTHIIAGSIDVLFLVMTGVIPWMRWLTGYMLPVLIGNCLGGVSLVAVINHAQVFAGEQQKKV
jgi:formate-nitrite transporter family protein